ncbi:MAG: hypothetical protein HQK83_10480 [Fibrobacteria bacterium]|nr:hypothetical protein [Fibrobacteria bacterium]
MNTKRISSFILFIGFTVGLMSNAWSQAPIRTNPFHEDTVRVLIIYNATATSLCDGAPVGEEAKDMVVNSIDGIPNVKVMPSLTTTWSNVQAAWPGTLPHVIVHVQAGFQSKNGPYVSSIMQNAADNAVGVVSLGDDAAFLAEDVFGFQNPVNIPEPMGDAVKYRDTGDRLWIALDTTEDVPQIPGIIKNAASLIDDLELDFKPQGSGYDHRCQADADRYDVVPTFMQQLSFMGHQRAYDASVPQTIGGPTELPVIAAFGNDTRRGVSLSFQPQYLVDSVATEQLIYDAIMWASFAYEGFKVDTPIATPPGKTFTFLEKVKLRCETSGADIYYKLGASGTYQKYTPDSDIDITETITLYAYGIKDGYKDSDTLTENYTMNPGTSGIVFTKITGEILGGNSTLSENDSVFIIKLTVPYATLTSVSIDVTTTNGKDTETLVITNPENSGTNLIFTDTVSFAVSGITAANNKVEADAYDIVNANWVNPVNSTDNASGSFSVEPASKPSNTYFSDINGNPVASLTGNETTLYVVVEDQIFNPSRIAEYYVTLTNNDKGDGNTSPPDKETFSLTELSPGKYIATIPLAESTPANVVSGNGTFEIRRGDQLLAEYVDPVDQESSKDNEGFGVATQIQGRIRFTNADFVTDATLMTGNMYDASLGKVYLLYEDDYVAAMTTKDVKITVTNTDGLGNTTVDIETLKLNFTTKTDSLGQWTLEVPLSDNPIAIPGDSILQFYFKGAIKAQAANHKSGAVEITTGDTAHAILNVAYGNQDENIIITDAITGLEVTRLTTQVKVCVEDQPFSNATIDTVLLERVQCNMTNDKLEGIKLIQTAANSNMYCGVINKNEAESGVLTDNILSCQDVDNLKAEYVDPVYVLPTEKSIPIIDPTITSVQFLDINGNPINSFNEATGSQIIVRLTNRSPNLTTKDTLVVKLKTDTGDTLDLLVYETEVNSGIFESVVIIGFSEEPNPNNNILEGRLTPGQANNMTVTGQKGSVLTSIPVGAAYIPVDKAWIVDGNHDGQADSIYIRFLDTLLAPPTSITSIDWPYDGAQGHTASYTAGDPANSINLMPDPTLIAILIPGAMDRDAGVFYPDKTTMDAVSPPFLTLPDGPVFQGQEVLIQDGIGAVVVTANKFPSNNTYYKDVDGKLQKQPDTLVIELSEKIRQTHDMGTPWDSLFMFSPGNDPSIAYPLISLTGSTPIVEGPDSLIWTFIVTNDRDNNYTPDVDDYIYLNPGAPYVDASPTINKPNPALKIILGVDPKRPIDNSHIYVPVTGVSLNDPSSMIATFYIDESTGLAHPARNAELILNPTTGQLEFFQPWVKPAMLQADGTVLPPDGSCNEQGTETTNQTRYPENCLSTVEVFSKEKYTAEITIFDHLGKFIHSSVQYFGYCGELQNKERRDPKGLRSWLIWNQKDLEGKIVGSGVYLWKVQFNTTAGKHTGLYRQGVVRSGAEPAINCAISE